MKPLASILYFYDVKLQNKNFISAKIKSLYKPHFLHLSILGEADAAVKKQKIDQYTMS